MVIDETKDRPVGEGTLFLAEIVENGTVKMRYSRRLSLDGSRWIRDGLFRSYFPNGSVSSEGTYVDDRENGPWRDFFEDGKIAAEGEYRLGREVGTWIYYSQDGSVEETIDHGVGDL
jgi:antitoxin component YwqK of YwqJK toxin-antitoxin module